MCVPLPVAQCGARGVRVPGNHTRCDTVTVSRNVTGATPCRTQHYAALHTPCKACVSHCHVYSTVCHVYMYVSLTPHCTCMNAVKLAEPLPVQPCHITAAPSPTCRWTVPVGACQSEPLLCHCQWKAPGSGGHTVPAPPAALLNAGHAVASSAVAAVAARHLPARLCRCAVQALAAQRCHHQVRLWWAAWGRH